MPGNDSSPRKFGSAVALRAATLLLAAIVCTSSGCCFWRKQNPVSESLMASRQLAQQGVNALDHRDLDEAERLLSQAVRACPDDPEANRHYADLLWQRDRRREALQQIDLALTKAPHDTAILQRAGEMHLQAGETGAALHCVEKLIGANPRAATAWTLRGRIMLERGDATRALADVQRALQYDPRDRDALRTTAEIYRRLNEPERSLVTLQALADTYKPGEEPQQLYLDEGATYTVLARHDDACSALRRAQSRGPASAEVYLLLAEAETAAGRGGAAFQAAQQASLLAPSDPRCQQAVARTAAAVGGGDATLRR